MTDLKASYTKPFPSSTLREHHHQVMLNNILKIALQSTFFKAKVESILDYLLAQKHLNFAQKAAFFVQGEDANHMILAVSKGFHKADIARCNTVQLGHCHCGQTAAEGDKRFFTTQPIHLKRSKRPYYGNYCIPIGKDKQPLGILTLYVTEEHRHSPDMARFLESLGNIFTVIVENQQMDQQLILLVNDLRSSIVNLREEKKFSESIIQGLNHGLIVADLNGTIRKSNSVARTIFKPFVDSLNNKNLSTIFGQEIAEKLLDQSSLHKNQQDQELTLTTSGGENTIINYSTVPRENSRGDIVGIIISLSDISELKYVRKEMEKMNRLSTIAEIASAVAHEVRNPLAGIKIMAQSIEEEAHQDSEQQECSQRIIRQVDRLNELLTDFFSYARPAEPNKRPTSLSVIIAETNPLIQNRLTKKHITLHETISPDLPKIIADPHQVQQVFLNLFLNAIDAIKERGRIDISAKVLSKRKQQSYKKKYPAIIEDCPYIVVDFTDNGAGMSADVAKNVFEPFFTTKTSGAGLGLSIVYRTLKENNAAIILKSGEGKGTTFTIFFQADI